MYRRTLLGCISASLAAGVAASISAVPLARGATRVPVLGFVSGELGGTFVQIAADLSELIPRNLLRVDVLLNRGSVQNLIDIATKPGIDLGTVAVDALPYIAENHLLPPELIARICYITRLYDNDVHVEAVPEIKQLSDLDGKPTNIDVPGAGTNLTLRRIFAAYGIRPDFREDPPQIAQAKLERGEIAALCYCIGKPGALFRRVPAGTSLHFVPVPYDARKLGVYVPAGEFTHVDYPTLVPEGQSVSTVGVGVVLAAFNFPPETPRYRHLAIFTDYFFSHFSELLQPGHHPKWREVNLAATQPGWTRFPEAVAWLNQSRTRAAFGRFLAEGGDGRRIDAADEDRLFRNFEAWEHRRRASR